MIICPECEKEDKLSTVYPIADSGQPFFDAAGEYNEYQRLRCSKGHEWTQELEKIK